MFKGQQSTAEAELSYPCLTPEDAAAQGVGPYQQQFAQLAGIQLQGVHKSIPVPTSGSNINEYQQRSAAPRRQQRAPATNDHVGRPGGRSPLPRARYIYTQTYSSNNYSK